MLVAVAAPNVLLLTSALLIWWGGRGDVSDGDAMQAMWASYAERPAARFRALMAGGIRVGFMALRAKLARSTEKRSELNTLAGKRAVKELIRLGPTYVKLGQIVSCRQDLVPDEYVQELKSLQDKVPAFSGIRAMKIIEEELGQPVSKLFQRFDEKPLAAASLGQVHRAVTLGGREVAIKVQRDKLKEMYDLDLAQFDKVTAILDKFKIGIQGATQGWSDIFKEAKVILYREIDYTAEAQNTLRFVKNFEKIPWVKVPNVFEELTTKHVLTMEYVPGIKISDLEKLDNTPGIDRVMLSKFLAQAYLLQFCSHGFFNTDPHPGNLAVDTAYPGGRLIFYDFGQACELQQSQSDGILQVIQSIVDLDAKACVEAMDKLGAVKKDAKREVIQGTIENNFKTGKVKSKRSKRKQELSLDEADAKPPTQAETMKYLQLPSQLAFVARAIGQLSGVGTMLDKDYEFIDCVAEKVPEIQMERGAGLGYLAGQFLKSLTRED